MLVTLLKLSRTGLLTILTSTQSRSKLFNSIIVKRMGVLETLMILLSLVRIKIQFLAILIKTRVSSLKKNNLVRLMTTLETSTKQSQSQKSMKINHHFKTRKKVKMTLVTLTKSPQNLILRKIPKWMQVRDLSGRTYPKIALN